MPARSSELVGCACLLPAIACSQHSFPSARFAAGPQLNLHTMLAALFTVLLAVAAQVPIAA